MACSSVRQIAALAESSTFFSCFLDSRHNLACTLISRHLQRMHKNGVIKKWDAARGFGFIQSKDSPSDVFFHHGIFRASGGIAPVEGMPVVFEDVHVGGKGPRAISVSHRSVDRPSSLQHTNAFADRRTTASANRGATEQLHNTARDARRRPYQRPSRAGFARQIFMAIILLGWLGLAFYGVATGRVSLWLLPWLVLINIATVFAYAFDKNAAEKGEWRTSEQTLHAFALAGGWPAAWAAQQVMRHKCSKASFQAAYQFMVFLDLAALALWMFWIPSIGS